MSITLGFGREPRRWDAELHRRAATFDPAQFPTPPAEFTALSPGLALNGFRNVQNAANPLPPIGNCTCAALGHRIEIMSLRAQGTERTVSDESIVAVYARVTGYDPRTGTNDRGANMFEVIKDVAAHGIEDIKLLAAVPLDPSDLYQQQVFQWLTGPLYQGAYLPRTTSGTELFRSTLWDLPNVGYSGGHAYLRASYNKTGARGQLATWASSTIAETDRFVVDPFQTWQRMDECYALVMSCDFHPMTGLTPNGHTPSQLAGWVRAAGGIVYHTFPPDPPPPPAPAPTPTAADDEIDWQWLRG